MSLLQFYPSSSTSTLSVGLNNKVLDVALSVSMQLGKSVDLHEGLNIWYTDSRKLMNYRQYTDN